MRFGRSVEAKGAAPRAEMALLIRETGNLERSYRGRKPVALGEVVKVRVAKKRFCWFDERACFR